MTIAVLGGGNGAFATAAHLTLKDFQVNLMEHPKFSDNIEPVVTRGGIELISGDLRNIPSGFARLNKISTEASEIIPEAKVIWLVVPAFAQKSFVEFCAPYFRSEQILVLAPGNFGAIEALLILQKMGLKNIPKIIEMETMIYFALKQSPTKVFVDSYKNSVRVAALPRNETPHLLNILKNYYHDLEAAHNVLETGLSNLNTVIHAPILLLNMGRIESSNPFIFYHEGCTPSVGKIVEALDRERLAVGQALGLQLYFIRELILKYYKHHGVKGRTLTELLATNPVYAKRLAPQKLYHRFLTEEIPYSMVILEELGELTNVSTRINSS